MLVRPVNDEDSVEQVDALDPTRCARLDLPRNHATIVTRYQSCGAPPLRTNGTEVPRSTSPVLQERAIGGETNPALAPHAPLDGV